MDNDILEIIPISDKDVEDVLKMTKNAHLEYIFLLGLSKEGNLYVAASKPEVGRALDLIDAFHSILQSEGE